MRKHIIIYILSWVLKIEALLLTLPIITALIYKETTLKPFLFTFLIALVLGFLLGLKKPEHIRYYAREGFIIVASSWILLSIIGALPFCFSKEIPNFTNALFEIISGFTTTGASILDNVENLSHASLLWRSLSHWIGGMGVLVFILIILPLTGGSNMHLMKSESPGPTVTKLVPRLRDTAFILYGIYFVMTIVEIILLKLSGMPFFDSVCLSFGSAGTGGFGIKSDSIGSYSTISQTIITIFMFLFGINFSFYFLILKKKFKEAFSLEEIKVYFSLFILSGIIIGINIYSQIENLYLSFHHAFFQVSSIMTTTGYSTCDFDLWPSLSKTILVTLMFIGACAGSTGGGIKVSRIIICAKQCIAELRTYIHPRNVQVMKIDNKVIEETTIKQVFIYLGTYIFIFIIALLFISIEKFDFTTNFTAIAATFNNIGPGLNKVGPMVNYNSYSILSKYVLMFCMLAGRLELYPLLLFFYPKTWKD